VEHPSARQLPSEEFGVLLRRVRTEVDLEAPELQLLRAQESAIVVELDLLRRDPHLVFRGQRLPLGVVDRMLEGGSPGRREEAWWALETRQRQDRRRLDSLLDEALGVRSELARTAGLATYPEFRWLEQSSHGWGPHEARGLMESIARSAIPRLRRWQDLVRRSTGVRSLRPWDDRLEPGGKLTPLRDPAALSRRCRDAFRRVHPGFGTWFEALLEHGQVDFGSGRSRSRRAWQGTGQGGLPVIRVPFTGRHRDVVKVLHEGGHAFHALSHRYQRLVWNRSAPVAFAEVVAHTLELIGSEHLEGAVYGQEDAIAARLRALGRVVRLLAGLARVELFQFWLHDHPHNGPRAREAAWTELGHRFDGDLDWSGLERPRGRGYLAHTSLLRDPFGQLPYTVALVGALQLWVRYRTDPTGVLARLRLAMSLGWTRDLRGLFEAAGLRFDFGNGHLAELMRHWDREVDDLESQLIRSVARRTGPGIADRSPTAARAG